MVVLTFHYAMHTNLSLLKKKAFYIAPLTSVISKTDVNESTVAFL